MLILFLTTQQNHSDLVDQVLVLVQDCVCFTLKMNFLIQGLWDRKSSMEKPGLGLTADMETQNPPVELGRMLSGNPGRFSTKVSIPPLFSPATCTLGGREGDT